MDTVEEIFFNKNFGTIMRTNMRSRMANSKSTSRLIRVDHQFGTCKKYNDEKFCSIYKRLNVPHGIEIDNLTNYHFIASKK